MRLYGAYDGSAYISSLQSAGSRQPVPMSKSATTREPLFSFSRSQRTQFLAAFEGVRSCLWSTSPRTQNSSSSMVATAYAGHVLFLFINRISFFYLCFFFFFFFFCLFVEKILDLFQLVYTYKYYLLLRLYEKMSWSSSSSCEISSRWKKKEYCSFLVGGACDDSAE